MKFDPSILLWVMAGVGAALLLGVAAHYFSPDASRARRRRRNNHRVVSKVKRPMVRLSFRTRKP